MLFHANPQHMRLLRSSNATGSMWAKDVIVFLSIFVDYLGGLCFGRVHKHEIEISFASQVRADMLFPLLFEIRIDWAVRCPFEKVKISIDITTYLNVHREGNCLTHERLVVLAFRGETMQHVVGVR